MGFFDRFRRGMRKSISSLSSTGTASPPSSPTSGTAPSTSLPGCTPSATHNPTISAFAKSLTWTGKADHGGGSRGKNNNKKSKAKSKQQLLLDDARARCRREHQELLSRFTMTFGTRRPSQLAGEDENDGDLSPHTSRRGSWEDAHHPPPHPGHGHEDGDGLIIGRP